MVRLPVWE